MNDRFVPADAVVERMLQRRAGRGDFTGLLFRASDLVAQTPQRRHPLGWWAPPWDVRLARWAVVGVALVTVISVTGIALLGGPWRASVTGPVAPIGTPSPSPSPSPIPTRSPSAAPFPAPTPKPIPTTSPTPAPTPLLGLAPGTYSSQVWQPRLTYTVPDGWWNDADDRTAFILGKGHESADNIEMLVDLYPPGSSCVPSLDVSRPHGVDDLMYFLANSPGIDVISRESVSIGGLDGWRVVIGSSSDSTCEHHIAFIVNWYDGIPLNHGVGDPQELIILGGPDGRTIGIQVRAEGALRDEATAIVDSFKFDLWSNASARQSQVFSPRLTFTAPATWGIAEENVALLSLRHGRPNDNIDVIANVFPPTIDRDGCQKGITMGRDSAGRMVAYWTSHPGVVASTPEPFSIGEVTGWRVDVSRDPDWKQSPKCTDEMFGPVDFLHLWKGNGAVQGSGIGETRKTLIVVDLPDGPTIGIKFAFHDTPALQEQALAIVKSFVFAPDGP